MSDESVNKPGTADQFVFIQRKTLSLNAERGAQTKIKSNQSPGWPCALKCLSGQRRDYLIAIDVREFIL